MTQAISSVNHQKSATQFGVSENVSRNSSLTLCGVRIKQDLDGRYCLNDLHKAGGKEKRHSPSYWLAIQQTEELIAELETTEIPVVSLEGRSGGTYVVKELVYAYAMWVSAKFHLHVIRTFDAVVIGQIQLSEARNSRERARLESPAMTDAVKYSRLAAGKEVKHYHFSTEFDLINRIALGMPSKQYRAAHCISKTEAIRDHLTPCEIKCIEHLQRLNASLIDVGMPYEARKEQLSKVYIQRHSRALLSEIKRLEF